MKGKLLIFSAPSGSGKTTLVKHLLSKNWGLAFSVSATSRLPRVNEKNGVDYHFLSPEEFEEKIRNHEFLEWEEVYRGIRYGTLKKDVELLREQGKHVLFDVDVVGGSNIKRQYGNEALAVFIRPPSIGELKKRLMARSTDSEETIATRMAKAEYELGFEPQFDRTIINDRLEEALAETETVVAHFLGIEQ
ncbi:MAG TPA: guanylate kinase [Prolixibacteraceae bacterium]|nr:guanylate kinase [Prolixibacteraceae bacterium]